MPRVVDAVQRRREIAEAVWRVVRRDGVPGASVRAVAREAGTSMGALRHWFGTQDELLRFAMELVLDRSRARVQLALTGAGPVRDRALRALEEVLPLDDERRAEAEVWLALTARGLVDPELAGVRDRSDAELHRLCVHVVAGLIGGGLVRPGVDRSVEAERLYAVLDGLALHALVRPATLPPDRAREVLAAHVDALRDRR